MTMKKSNKTLSQDLLKLLERFHENCMILNLEKYHYMSLGKDSVSDLLRFCGEVFETSKLEAVLGYKLTTN